MNGKWWKDFDEDYSQKEEARYQNERWDVYERRVKERINEARSMINGRRRAGESDRKWLDQFTAVGHGLDICCGSMPITNAMGVDLEYLGPLCFGRTSGDNLSGHKSRSADFIVTNYFDVWESPIKALHEWHRVLRVDGILALVCRNAEAYVDAPEGPLTNGNRSHLQTPLTMRMYLNRTGFEVMEIRAVRKTLRVVARRK